MESLLGTFIVIEGLDGAGTTTQTRRLCDWLIARGHKTLATFEPSGGPIGLLLRQILAGRTVMRAPDGAALPIHNDAIALLFAADRMDHLHSEVLPFLEDGGVVVSDRYYHSSLTYQSLQGDVGWIRRLNERARRPDVTYVLKVAAAEAERRRHKVRAGEELYENLPTQQRLEAAYGALPTLLPDEAIVPIDGAAASDEVLLALKADLRRRFGWA